MDIKLELEQTFEGKLNKIAILGGEGSSLREIQRYYFLCIQRGSLVSYSSSNYYFGTVSVRR